MPNWQKQLKFDPIALLLAFNDEALTYFAERDLLNEEVGSIQSSYRILRRFYG